MDFYEIFMADLVTIKSTMPCFRSTSAFSEPVALEAFKLHLGSPGSGMPSVEDSEDSALAWSHSEQ